MENASNIRRRPRVYYGWVIVAVVALSGYTHSAETFPVLGVFLKPITEEFNWSRSLFTGSTTIGTLLGGLVAVGMGQAIDRFGARWILTLAFVILGGTLVLMAFITTLWHFYALQILGRCVAMGVVSLAMRIIIPKWFVARRGRAVAIGGLGNRIGNTVTPLYVQLLVSLWSWRVAVAAAGVAMWVISLLPVAIFLRRQPEDMGLLPDGASPEKARDRQDMTPGVARPPSSGLDVSLSIRQVVRLPSFYLLTVGLALTFVVAPGLALHMIPFFTDRDIGSGTAVVVLALWSASGGLGSLIFGFLVERYSIRVVLSTLILLMAAGFFTLLHVHSAPPAFLWAFFQGIVQGGVFTLPDIIFANYYGRASLGTIRGVVWPVQMVANSTGPLSAALAFDATGSYVTIFTIFGILTLVASLCVFLARPPDLRAYASPSRMKGEPFPGS